MTVQVCHVPDQIKILQYRILKIKTKAQHFEEILRDVAKKKAWA